MKIILFVILFALTTLSAPLTVYAAEYRHPSGVAFEYPQDWQLRELEESLLLVPSKPTGSSPNQTVETLPQRFIWIGSEAVAPDTPIDHPEFAAYFDNAISLSYPTARRQSMSRRGDVGVLEFRVDRERMVNVLYRLENGLALFMAHSYKPSDESVQDTVFAETFASFRVSLKQDANLVGSWYRSDTSMTDISYDSNTNGSSYASSSSQHRYTFFPNNRFEYESSAQVYAQSASNGGTASASSGDANPVDSGTYAADGSALSLAWDGGDTVECAYNTFLKNDGAPALKMQCGDEAKFYTLLE